MKQLHTLRQRNLQTNETKLRLNLQVLLRCPEKFLQYFLQVILARHSCKGFSKGFCSGTLEPLTLKALKPRKPATLDSWSFGTFESWNPATLEFCNPGALEPWNPRPFASLEPALGTLKLYLKQYESLGPLNFEIRKLGVLEVWASRVMDLWNPKLGLLQSQSLGTLPGNREPCEKLWTFHLVKL